MTASSRSTIKERDHVPSPVTLKHRLLGTRFLRCTKHSSMSTPSLGFRIAAADRRALSPALASTCVVVEVALGLSRSVFNPINHAPAGVSRYDGSVNNRLCATAEYCGRAPA